MTRLRAWRLVKTSLWGLADQTLVSATSFVTVVLLARALGPGPFGAFTVVYTALLIANTIQIALVTQPLNVFGATRSSEQYRAYTGSTLVVQLAFAAAVAGAALGAAGIAHVADTAYGPLLLALAPAAFGWQLQEFARRVLYTEGRVAAALATDLVTYGGQIAGLAALWATDRLDGTAAMWTIAATSAAGLLLGAWQIRRSVALTFESASAKRNWAFGKWLVGAMAGFTLSSHLYTYLAAGIVGAFAAGVLKAAQVLLGPLNVVLLFLNNVLPIRLARAYSTGGDALLRSRLGAAYAISLPIVAVYCAATSLLAEPLLSLVYGEAYEGYGTVVVLFGLFYFLSYTAQLVTYALYATRATRPVFLGHAGGAAIAIGLGWLLVAAFEIEGAVLGMILSVLVLNAVVWSVFALRRPRGRALEA